jgi:hypothetical protein
LKDTKNFLTARKEWQDPPSPRTRWYRASAGKDGTKQKILKQKQSPAKRGFAFILCLLYNLGRRKKMRKEIWGLSLGFALLTLAELINATVVFCFSIFVFFAVIVFFFVLPCRRAAKKEKEEMRRHINSLY